VYAVKLLARWGTLKAAPKFGVSLAIQVIARALAATAVDLLSSLVLPRLFPG